MYAGLFQHIKIKKIVIAGFIIRVGKERKGIGILLEKITT